MLNFRNMAFAKAITSVRMPDAIWNAWSTFKAVKEGYKVSGWVYRAISIKAKAAASVPWYVADENGEPIPEHPLTLLFKKPNSSMSRQDLIELIVSWLELSGKAFIKYVESNNAPLAMWPVSPDRLIPLPSPSDETLLRGYTTEVDKERPAISSDYTEKNVIHFKYLDPANPIDGIGPLQVAAKAVDTDVEQSNFNKSVMQNKGIMEGVFTFKRDIADKSTYTIIKESIKEMMANAQGKRDIGVIGSDATYQRLSLGPNELDFLVSRKFNREEIFIIFGVPSQLAGTQEFSTYNNYSTSNRIFWESTMIPLLDDLCDTLNFFFAERLGGYSIKYGLENVPALQTTIKERAETAKVFNDMGVPVSVLNSMFKLGIEEYNGWDISPKLASGNANTATEQRKRNIVLKPFEKRNIDAEIQKREDEAQKTAVTFARILDKQKTRVFEAMDKGEDTTAALNETEQELQEALNSAYRKTALKLASDVVMVRSGTSVPEMEFRALADDVAARIDTVLRNEATVLSELSFITKTTFDQIRQVFFDGENEGQSISEIQQALTDLGTFSHSRALTIARTVSGTAQSIGQMAAGAELGATKKVWRTSNLEVRDQHVARSFETVDMESRFSVQFPGSVGPRYPLDQEATAADRINCRCSLSFE